MKKLLYLATVIVATLFATSCTQEDVFTGNTQEVTFTASVGNSVSTRAISDGTTAKNLSYAVYYEDGRLIETLSGTTTVNNDLTANVKLSLIKGQSYQIVFWAQAEGAPYTFNQAEGKIYVSYEGAANDEKRDAFYTKIDYTVTSKATETVYLRRPFAQVNFATTAEDLELAAKAGYVPETSNITFTEIPYMLDVLDGTASGSVDVAYTMGNVPNPAEEELVLKEGGNYEYLATGYILAGDQMNTNINAVIKGANGQEVTIKVPNAPYRRNYRTNILGNLLTNPTEFNVIIVPDYIDDIILGSQPITPNKEGIYEISNVAQLTWFAEQVNGGERFADKTFVLTDDIDLASVENWKPIGHADSYYNINFTGTFDGQGHTIKNLTSNQNNRAGLFGSLCKGTIKNVNFENVNLTSNHYAGAVVAWIEKGAQDIIIENCHVDGININCTPELLENGSYDNGDKVGGIAGFVYKGTVKDCSVTNANITAYRDLGGIVGYSNGATITGNTISESVINQNNTNAYKTTIITTASAIVGNTGNADNTVGNNVTVNFSVTVDAEGNYLINDASGLTWLAYMVNNGIETKATGFEKMTIKLNSDVDLKDYENWTPIGNSTNKFEGTFDGQNHTIYNLNITGNTSNVGLFGYTVKGEIKNLTMENAKVSGYLNVGVVAGTPYTSKYTNITLKGLVQVDGFSYVGAVGGKNAYADWNGITVDVDANSYVKAYSIENGTAFRSYVGGVVGFNGEGSHTFQNIHSNINVFGSTQDVGGLFGIAHYGNKFINCSSSGNVEITDAEEIGEAEEIGGIAGTWHNSTGYSVTFNDCTFTGKLTTNIEGVDLSNNTTFGAAYSSTGKGTLIIDDVEYKAATTQEDITDAVTTEGATIRLNSGEYEFPKNIAKGVTILCESNTVFTGNTKLNINGATVIGATFSNPGGTAVDQIINGTFKSCTFDGNNGLRWCYAGETVVFEDCVFSGDVYGIHFDGGANDIVFKNCTISGFNATASAVTMITFEGCTFKSNGRSGYNGINLWGSATMKDCNFIFDGSVGNEWIECIGSDKTYTFTNCTINGENINNEKFIPEYLNSRNHVVVTIDGENVQL